MTWFLVDDGFHSHPKAAAASLAAIGLWTAAGSWCSDHLTDGNIPETMIRSLSRGAVELADELVTCGLWRRTRAGYRFHQWNENGDGIRRNRTRKEVEELRRKKADAGRKGGVASAKTRSTTQARASPTASRSVQPLSLPLASNEARKGARRAAPTARALPPNAPRCPRHEFEPADNCASCRSEAIGAA